jgi:hypothetical protein
LTSSNQKCPPTSLVTGEARPLPSLRVIAPDLECAPLVKSTGETASLDASVHCAGAVSRTKSPAWRELAGRPGIWNTQAPLATRQNTAPLLAG